MLSEVPSEQVAILAEIAALSEKQIHRAVRNGRIKMNVFKSLLRLRNAVKPRSPLPLPE